MSQEKLIWYLFLFSLVLWGPDVIRVLKLEPLTWYLFLFTLGLWGSDLVRWLMNRPRRQGHDS